MRARLLCSEPGDSSGEGSVCGGSFLSAGLDDNNGQEGVAIAPVFALVLLGCATGKGQRAATTHGTQQRQEEMRRCQPKQQ